MRRDPSRPARVRQSRQALATAIHRNEWELAALLLLEALASVSRTLPPGTIDDVLALISKTEEADGAGR
jgi:hypothetical protein